MSIGPDANAATRYNDTQYTLRVPTDVPGVLDRAMLVLEDWAHGATFDQSGIDRERGIVLSEWRMNLGASERTADAIRARAARRLALRRFGRSSAIRTSSRNASREALTRFYRDWYRPDLMAVIVVGDIDRDAMVAMIKVALLVARDADARAPAADVRRARSARAPATPSSPTRRRRRTAVELTNLRPARNQGTVGGYRDIIRDQLFSDMLSSRFNELQPGLEPAVSQSRG